MEKKVKLKLQKNPEVYERLLRNAIFDNKSLTQSLLDDDNFIAYMKANYKKEYTKDYGHGSHVDYEKYIEDYALEIIDNFHNEDHKLFLLWLQINRILVENCFLQTVKGIKKLYKYYGCYRKLSNFILLLEEVSINMETNELSKELSEENYPIIEPEDIVHTLNLADKKDLDFNTIIPHDVKFLNEHHIDIRKGMYDWGILSNVNSQSSSFTSPKYAKEKNNAIPTENTLRQLVVRSIEMDRPLEWRLAVHLVSMTKLWNYAVEQVSRFYDSYKDIFEHWVTINNICPKFFFLQSRLAFIALNKVLHNKYKNSSTKSLSALLNIIKMLEEVYA